MILAWIERVENAFKGLMRFQKPTQHVSSQETDKPECMVRRLFASEE